MVSVQERKLKGNSYLYLNKSVRIKDKVIKLSKFLGKKSDFSKEQLSIETKQFALDAGDLVISSLVKEAQNKFIFKYPLSLEEVKKIEEMNWKYKAIKRHLPKKDWGDLIKRFVANFVFESNALEGNSLTLKSFSEIVFENRVSKAADLREVYDAQNSYAIFNKILGSRKDMTEEFIISLHKQMMKNIDDRVGYKQIPNFLLGRNIDLADPKEVGSEMKKLLLYYHQNKEKIYPLELAFVFHHRFEKIHPFADGNGRVGRMLLNYILIQSGYFPVIIRKNQREKYLKALEAADRGNNVLLVRFALEKAKETYRKFFEIYYLHTKLAYRK